MRPCTCSSSCVIIDVQSASGLCRCDVGRFLLARHKAAIDV